MPTNLTRRANQLSISTIGLAAALFAAGALTGWIAYLHRSLVLATATPGTSAWWQHGCLALAAGLALVIARWHRARNGARTGWRWLLAPFGRQAARRIAETFGAARHRPSACWRAVLALPPGGLFLYCFWRAGHQVTAGLDPNSTINAWGGPSYLGALACHYLDCALLAALAAWLLSLILLPAAGISAASEGSRSDA